MLWENLGGGQFAERIILDSSAAEMNYRSATSIAMAISTFVPKPFRVGGTATAAKCALTFWTTDSSFDPRLLAFQPMLHEVGEAILQPLLEIACYYVGRIVVPILSLGRVKCDRITADTPRRKLRWGGAYHRRGQQIYLTAEATAGAGLILLVLILTGTFLTYYLTS